MPIHTRNKLSASFSMASMSDLVFLLLIFFMITSTLVAPNALKLLLPQSNSQTSAKPVTTISITKDLKYWVNDGGELKNVQFEAIEPFLKQTIKGTPDSPNLGDLAPLFRAILKARPSPQRAGKRILRALKSHPPRVLARHSQSGDFDTTTCPKNVSQLRAWVLETQVRIAKCVARTGGAHRRRLAKRDPARRTRRSSGDRAVRSASLP